MSEPITIQDVMGLARDLHGEHEAELTRLRAMVKELTAALDWIICYVDEHPEWDFAYFREGGECHAESDWYDASTAALAKAKQERTTP